MVLYWLSDYLNGHNRLPSNSASQKEDPQWRRITFNFNKSFRLLSQPNCVVGLWWVIIKQLRINYVHWNPEYWSWKWLRIPPWNMLYTHLRKEKDICWIIYGTVISHLNLCEGILQNDWNAKSAGWGWSRIANKTYTFVPFLINILNSICI